MGHCPTIRHESLKKKHLFCFSTLMVVFSTQSSKMGACTTCLIWPHGSSHASKPPKFATLQGLLRILLSGEHKKYQATFLKYAPLVILSVSQSPTNQARTARFWLEPPQMSSLQCSCPNQTSPITSLALGPCGQRGLPREGVGLFVRTDPRQVKVNILVALWHYGIDLVGIQFWKMETLLVSICWEARVVERSIFGRQYWIKSDRKQL